MELTKLNEWLLKEEQELESLLYEDSKGLYDIHNESEVNIYLGRLEEVKRVRRYIQRNF